MASIHELIEEAAVEFEASTGKKPLNVYLGKIEIEALKRWAIDNQYMITKDADIRGENRPEVGGLIVYAVNEITHVNCA